MLTPQGPLEVEHARFRKGHPAGAARRAEIEKATDENSVTPYAHIGVSACAELQALVRPFSRALAARLMPWVLARQE
ncbi:helix-turn-helix domain-containing protein [Amycolatopsis lexingtonensis]|uniref:helix-turn-helix domain-containing protein n=1 Tax=Amycolatopsis lexingtonensis TaxID=218822 RepID=UPI003F70090A